MGTPEHTEGLTAAYTYEDPDTGEVVQMLKAERSGTNGCITIGKLGGLMLVGDTKDPAREPFRFDPTELQVFVDAAAGFLESVDVSVVDPSS